MKLRPELEKTWEVSVSSEHERLMEVSSGFVNVFRVASLREPKYGVCCSVE